MKPTASKFLSHFYDELWRDPANGCCTSVSRWQRIVKDAAASAMVKFGLETLEEVTGSFSCDGRRFGYRLDVAGLDSAGNVRIAFEHEQGYRRPRPDQIPLYMGRPPEAHWELEVCKLCLVPADLRVLVAYYTARVDPQGLLRNRLLNFALQVPMSKWLFIFGPARSTDPPWVYYTLTRAGGIRELTHPAP